LVSISSAETSRRHDCSWGNTLITLVRRFNSWFCRSRIFVVRIRFTRHVHILEMNGDSYRLKQSRRKRTQSAEL
jgi:hypothetical protein